MGLHGALFCNRLGPISFPGQIAWAKNADTDIGYGIVLPGNENHSVSQENQYTVQRHEYSVLLKVVNQILAWASKIGSSCCDLDQASLLKTAKEKAGLEDWGNNNFLTPMERLLAEADQCRLTHFARTLTRQALLTALDNRLQVQQFLTASPKLRDTKIERPIFVVGFPRTGTTVLQNLLSLPSNRRALQFWEMMKPAPLHEDPIKDRRVRLEKAERTLALAYWVAPEQREVHEIQATTFEECWPLFVNAFSVMNYDLASGLEGYGDWLMGQDMVGPYREYRAQLQILLDREPADQLVLKCPEHLWFLDALLEVFPDACIIWTHRDPIASIASYCSLVSLNRRMLYGQCDPIDLGRHISQRFLTGVQRAMAVRDKVGEERFYDVDFLQLVQNPKQVLERVHGHFGLKQPNDMNAQIDGWLNNKRSDAKGRHRYAAERYGLDAETVHGRYAEYIQRFDIPLGTRPKTASRATN